MHIGTRIKLQREILGMTQLELANKLGYKDRTTIAKIEKGTNDITQSKVKEFADILKTTPAYLMGWEDEVSADERMKEEKLVHSYRKLNPKGRDKLVDTAKEMTYNPLYNDNYQEEIKHLKGD